MNVTLFMAISLNGIIARENNEEDFLSHDNWNTFVELAKSTGCMIWGRKTQEIVETWEGEYLNDIKDIKKVVISSNPNLKLGENYIQASSPVDSLNKLEREGIKSVTLTGGSQLNSSFAKEELIDEIKLNIEPVVVGKGISLFYPTDFDLKLKLLSTKQISDQIIQVHYSVIK